MAANLMVPTTQFESLPPSGPSLLISDDDRGWRETLQQVFEPQGFRTLLAADGEEAWSIVQIERVHLVLLDLHMPRLTGLELLRQFQDAQMSLPCVLMSAAMDENLEREALQASAHTVLSKPISFHEIRAVVGGIMRSTYRWQQDS